MPHPITATTQLVGLIGHPVSHSVSPAMHNAAFDALGLDWRYVPLPVERGRVGDAVRGVRALGLRGINVTVPHKQAVLECLDTVPDATLTDAARTIGAVNTIRVEEDGSLLGDNTDARGFIADLREHGVDSAGRRALVIGAGGSARAVVYGLAEAGCAEIVVLNRTLSKAQSLVGTMRSHFRVVKLRADEFPGEVESIASEVDLIVNCTSLGMSPRVEGMPWVEDAPFRRDQVVYDLVYNPAKTRLLQKAEADGARAINGLGMLVWQGALAFALWTGEAPPVEVMRRAVEGR